MWKAKLVPNSSQKTSSYATPSSWTRETQMKQRARYYSKHPNTAKFKKKKTRNKASPGPEKFTRENKTIQEPGRGEQGSLRCPPSQVRGAAPPWAPSPGRVVAAGQSSSLCPRPRSRGAAPALPWGCRSPAVPATSSPRRHLAARCPCLRPGRRGHRRHLGAGRRHWRGSQGRGGAATPGPALPPRGAATASTKAARPCPRRGQVAAPPHPWPASPAGGSARARRVLSRLLPSEFPFLRGEAGRALRGCPAGGGDREQRPLISPSLTTQRSRLARPARAPLRLYSSARPRCRRGARRRPPCRRPQTPPQRPARPLGGRGRRRSRPLPVPGVPGPAGPRLLRRSLRAAAPPEGLRRPGPTPVHPTGPGASRGAGLRGGERCRVGAGWGEVGRGAGVAVADRDGSGCRRLACGARLVYGAPRPRGLGDVMTSWSTLPVLLAQAGCRISLQHRAAQSDRELHPLQCQQSLVEPRP